MAQLGFLINESDFLVSFFWRRRDGHFRCGHCRRRRRCCRGRPRYHRWGFSRCNSSNISFFKHWDL